MVTYKNQKQRKGVKLDIDSLTDILPLLGVGGVEETGVDDVTAATGDIAEAAQQSNMITDVVQGIKDVGQFVEDAQSFLPSQTLRLLDDLTKRTSPAAELNKMFSDIRINAPALSRLSAQNVSPFLQDPEQNVLNDVITFMRQMQVR